MQADAAELRVLGCLIEKQRTTPDVYPLSLNALRLACNQAVNRDAVVEYDEATIRAALERLSGKGWMRLASGPGSRAAKYRHLVDDALDLVPSHLALLAVLMLRGPQTPGELKARSDRLYPVGSIEDVERTLEALIERGLVARLPRRPGQKEERYRQLLGGADPEEIPGAVSSDEVEVVGEPYTDRVEALEARIERLETELASLRRGLESSREHVSS